MLYGAPYTLESEPKPLWPDRVLEAIGNVDLTRARSIQVNRFDENHPNNIKPADVGTNPDYYRLAHLLELLKPLAANGANMRQIFDDCPPNVLVVGDKEFLLVTPPAILGSSIIGLVTYVVYPDPVISTGQEGEYSNLDSYRLQIFLAPSAVDADGRAVSLAVTVIKYEPDNTYRSNTEQIAASKAFAYNIKF